MNARAWKVVALVGHLAILAALLMPGSGAVIPRLAVAFVALALVLVLPGYALTAVLFRGDRLGSSEKLLLTLSLSVAIAALGGFVLHWTRAGLRTETWVLLLTGITLLTGFSVFREGRNHAPARTTPEPRMPLRHALLFGLAGLIVVAAMAVARDGAVKDLAAPVTQLWILPVESDKGAFELGVANLEPQTVEYRLRVVLDNDFFQDLPAITLEPSQKWEVTLSLPPNLPKPGTITALLYREDAPDSVYRKVVLRPPG